MSRQQQIQPQTQTQARVFVTGDQGVTFSGGVMHVDGRPQIPDTVERWESSNGTTQYATVAWRDPNTGELRASCNCPAWAMKKRGKDRGCKHCRHLTGTGSCDAKQLFDHVAHPRTVAEATSAIPKLTPRPLRGLLLDDD